MEKKGNYISRVLKTIVSFTISYAFVVIMYVLISEIGVFDPIDNQKAIQLLGICFVIAAFHFIIGFWNIQSGILMVSLYFGVVVVVVGVMGGVVYDFLDMNAAFLVCLTIMLLIVFTATFLLAYYEDCKKVWEINEIIKKNKKI